MKTMGLFYSISTASRWPIDTEAQHEFEAKNSGSLAGFFIPKGVNYAKIIKEIESDSKVYHIFNTHFEVGFPF